MSARHLELLVEELSMEAFLRELLPRILPADRTFDIRAFQGKPDLLGKLENRRRPRPRLTRREKTAGQRRINTSLLQAQASLFVGRQWGAGVKERAHRVLLCQHTSLN